MLWKVHNILYKFLTGNASRILLFHRMFWSWQAWVPPVECQYCPNKIPSLAMHINNHWHQMWEIMIFFSHLHDRVIQAVLFIQIQKRINLKTKLRHTTRFKIMTKNLNKYAVWLCIFMILSTLLSSLVLS